jgi:hypothetical protein
MLKTCVMLKIYYNPSLSSLFFFFEKQIIIDQYVSFPDINGGQTNNK